jgi:uncharacterized protein
MRRLSLLSSTILLFTGVACDPSNAPGINFDRKAMLENLAYNLIIPSYANFETEVTTLNAAANLFIETPDVTSLQAVRESFVSSYKAYQHCALYNFGPAEAVSFKSALNTFPISRNKISNNITSASYDLNSISSADAKGFATLDYLLFGLHTTDEGILDFYISDSESAKRKQYLTDVINDITMRAKTVADAWESSIGNYASVFISKTGLDVGSSAGILVNILNQFYEADIRDAKIGIPLGVRSLGIPIPNNCEGLYSEMSVTLALESITALQHVFLGKSNSQDGIGFDDYIAATNAKYNGEKLHEAMIRQLETMLTKISAIPEPYSKTVETNPVPAEEAYLELQKFAVLFKADMPSALGVLITYQDNDGD